MKEKIIKEIECLMADILIDNIPTRRSLDSDHTLKQTKFWRGADLTVTDNIDDVIAPHAFYGQDVIIVTNLAYQLSWVLCELRDIYSRNDFFDYDLKYHIYGKFADRFNSYQKQSSNDKDVILKSLQDLIYSNEFKMLPNDNTDLNSLTIDHIQGEA